MIAGQLELDLDDDGTPIEHAGDEPETLAGEAGWLLLRLLSLNGWDVDVVPGFGGGVLVVARQRCSGIEVKASGATVAECATTIVGDAHRFGVRPAAEYAPRVTARCSGRASRP